MSLPHYCKLCGDLGWPNGCAYCGRSRTVEERVARLRGFLAEQVPLAVAIDALAKDGHVAEAHALAGWVGKIDAEATLLERALRSNERPSG